MNVLTREGIRILTSTQKTILEDKPQQPETRQFRPLVFLTARQEAFIRERFSTKLEDSMTGKRVRI